MSLVLQSLLGKDLSVSINSSILLDSASHPGEFLAQEKIVALSKANINVISSKNSYFASGQEFLDIIRGLERDEFPDIRIVNDRHNEGVVIFQTFVIKFKFNFNSIQLSFYGLPLSYEPLVDKFNSLWKRVESVINWMYDADGSYITIPLENDRSPIQEMYPFMNRSLEDYYQAYIESTASILLLIGPPGTGKTSWIRGFLNYYNKNSIVTYDANILKKDYIFADFLESDKGVMVIEDADNFLGSRSEGNDIMHKFLNVGDGLVTIKGKKLIFSTNLPSIKDVDPALVRPGRCFDVLNFRNLNKDEAANLSSAVGIEFNPPEDKNTFSVGDIYHTQNTALVKPKFGFL